MSVVNTSTSPFTNCKQCGTNIDEWFDPVSIGMCQACWEDEVDRSWWEEVYPLSKMFCEGDEDD